jgi:hypothetical protein
MESFTDEQQYTFYETLNQLRLHREHESELGTEHVTEPPAELWKHDMAVWVGCAPSWRYIYDMGWYDKPMSEQRADVYCKGTEESLDRSRLAKKGFWREPDYVPEGGHPVPPVRERYTPETEAFLEHMKIYNPRKWCIFGH